MTVTSQDAQNPAYRPTPFILSIQVPGVVLTSGILFSDGAGLNDLFSSIFTFARRSPLFIEGSRKKTQ